MPFHTLAGVPLGVVEKREDRLALALFLGQPDQVQPGINLLRIASARTA